MDSEEFLGLKKGSLRCRISKKISSLGRGMNRLELDGEGVLGLSWLDWGLTCYTISEAYCVIANPMSREHQNSSKLMK